MAWSRTEVGELVGFLGEKKSPEPFAGLDMERKNDRVVKDDSQVFSLPDWIALGHSLGRGPHGVSPA